MKKQNFWLGLILLLLLIALVVFLNQKIKANDKTCKFSLDEIEKIELVLNNVNKVILVNDDGQWVVNGIVPVKKEPLEQLYSIVSHIERKQRVNEHILFDIRQELMNSPEIKIWSNGKIVKSFYIGPPISDSSGNYYMPSDDMLAYVVYVPGQKANLQDYFKTDPNYWRDYHIFRGIISRVKYITYHEPGQEKKKKVIDSSLRQQLSQISVSRYIDEAGMIDSLRWAAKHSHYLCRIEFFDGEQIPKAKLTCFKINDRFLLLFEDFGANSVAAVISKKDMELLTKLKD